MELDTEQIQTLKELMVNSAKKGNLANSGIVIENGNTIAEAESWVVTNHDATNNYTPGLTLVTVCEPCLMCMSACAWAGYKTLAYIIPANKYIAKIPWMSDNTKINKQEVASTFSEPVELIHLTQYEEEFSAVFEKEMERLLK